MLKQWMLSTFYRDAVNDRRPLCASYGGQSVTPRFPDDEDGWALVRMSCTRHQIEAASQDPEVVVLPKDGDSTAVPAIMVATYGSLGVVDGMTMAQAVAVLAESEPLYQEVDLVLR